MTFEFISILVRFLSARYFKFMIKSWNFVRIFLCSFLLEILRETFLETAKTLTSVLFCECFFSLQISTIYSYIIGKQMLYWFNNAKELYLKMSISWDILCWLAYIIMKILFNYAHCMILEICERTKWFPRIWLIKTLVCSKDQKLWSKKNRLVKSFQKQPLRGV